MARRYYRRRTVVVRPKKKWASNFIGSNLALNTDATNTVSAAGNVLVQNSAQSSSPTPTIVKAGNFKVQGDCYFAVAQGNQLMQCMLYVMFVPQGIPLNVTADYTNLISSHPEWIMAWKMIDMNGTSNEINSFTFSSRLKRNLNSGDSIRLIGVAEAGGTNAVSFAVTTKVQYWTTTA